jgi:hypothetical protein
MTGTEALAGLIVLGLLCALYLGPWQRAWEDHARDIVFAERDAIFDMACAHELEFGSEPYEELRSAMNALIRYAHRATLPRLLFHVVTHKPSPAAMTRIQVALTKIHDPNVRAVIARRVQRAEANFVGSMVARSILTGAAVFLLFFVRNACRKLCGIPDDGSFREALEKVGTVVQAEAEIINV